MKLTPEQKQEIAEQQAQNNSTKRVTSPELEKILYEALPVLDHGFVRVLVCWRVLVLVCSCVLVCA